MKNPAKKWLYFTLMCLIWGSSFILMKLGLYASSGVPVLSAIQVAAVRIFSASLVLLPFAWSASKRVPKKLFGKIFQAGLLGSFFPAFLFCIAETRIDSALTAMINSTTPIFAIICSALLFKKLVPANQVLGVFVGFLGCLLLFYSNKAEPVQNLLYAGFVVLATVFYGLNVNLVKQNLHMVNSRDLAALSFMGLLIPSGVILLLSGYFKLPLGQSTYLKATLASALLGVMGTAIATIIFYALVKIATPVFASLVTYGIPFVAIGWGLLYGETIGIGQVLSLLVILAGVYIASLPIFKMPVLLKRK